MPTTFFISLNLIVQNNISNRSSKVYKYDRVSRFSDDLCAINDNNEFLTLFKNIYSKKLELKVERQGNHTWFLDLDVKIENSVFAYKLFDKRDKFPFFMVRMPYLWSNLPSAIFCWSVISELARVARCTLKINDFIS